LLCNVGFAGRVGLTHTCLTFTFRSALCLDLHGHHLHRGSLVTWLIWRDLSTLSASCYREDDANDNHDEANDEPGDAEAEAQWGAAGKLLLVGAFESHRVKVLLALTDLQTLMDVRIAAHFLNLQALVRLALVQSALVVDRHIVETTSDLW